MTCPSSRATRCVSFEYVCVHVTTSQTECACLQFADEISTKSYDVIRKKYPESSYVKVCTCL